MCFWDRGFFISSSSSVLTLFYICVFNRRVMLEAMTLRFPWRTRLLWMISLLRWSNCAYSLKFFERKKYFMLADLCVFVCVCFRLKISVSALIRLTRTSQKSKNSTPPSCQPPHLTRVSVSDIKTPTKASGSVLFVTHFSPFHWQKLRMVIDALRSVLFFQESWSDTKRWS